ncbi:hypothetical protein [Acinetobacter pittii]|uniref:hypothetical protein n=1 Tax=Acinetobacter pittii TaxID=48296 RepID=UPI00148D8D87|nr:hypothetical protein [Acinetobacter pittii]
MPSPFRLGNKKALSYLKLGLVVVCCVLISMALGFNSYHSIGKGAVSKYALDDGMGCPTKSLLQ